MSTIFEDFFDRAGPGLGTDWTINTADGGGAGFAISSNRIVPADTSNDQSITNGTGTYPTNYRVTLTFTATAAGGVGAGCGPNVREVANSASTYYRLVGNASGYSLVRAVSNAFTTLKSASGTTFAAADTISLQAVTNGSQIDLTMYKNGVQFDSFSDTDASRITAANLGGVGYSSTDTGTTVDHYLAETVAAGGTTTTKVMSDNVVVAEAAFNWLRRTRVASDNVVVSDGTVVMRRLRRILEDSLTIADSIVKSVTGSGGQLFTKVMSDTLSIFDENVHFLRLSRVVSDTVTMFDEVLRYLRFKRLMSDNVVVFEENWRTITLIMTDDPVVVTDEEFDRLKVSRLASDNVVVADQTIAWLRRRRLAEDSLSITDGLVSWLRRRRLAEDDLDITDGFSRVVNGAGGTVYTKVMSDATVIVDDVGQRWRFIRTTLSDAIAMFDEVVKYRSLIRQGSDDVVVTDNTSRIMRLQRTMTDLTEIQSEVLSSYLPSMTFVVHVRLGVATDLEPVLGVD